MNGKFDSRHPLVGLVDEVARLNGRLKSVFAEARRSAELGDSEMMVLNAVVEADRSPTVSQIGRSLGQPRQIVQRAANALVGSKLLVTRPNLDHKRAVLLVATDRGIALKREIDARADSIAAALTTSLDLDAVQKSTQSLRVLRKELEAQLRASGT